MARTMGYIKPPRFQYFIQHRFLWFWGVVNELGRPIYYGTQGSCQALANLLNLMWDNGYAHGQLDCIQAFNPSKHDKPKSWMEMQLQQALQSEDYEEAARLRDLMNKK